MNIMKKNINNGEIKKPIFNKDATCIRYTIKVKNKYDSYLFCIKHGVDMGFSFNHIPAPVEMKGEHKIANEIMNLPYYYQMSTAEMKKVVEVVNKL